MLIGGIWHGASWTMVIWGAMHGMLLVINYAFRWLIPIKINKALAKFIIFTLLVITWVPFRSESLDTMINIYKGMLGLNGVVIPFEIGWILDFALSDYANMFGNLKFATDIVFMAIPTLLLIVWFFPNTYDWMSGYKPVLSIEGYPETEVIENKNEVSWKPTFAHAFIIALLLFLTLLKMNDVSEFIYFQF